MPSNSNQASAESIGSVLPEQLTRLGGNWGWFLAAGICYVIFGIVAFNWPVDSTVSLTFALGVLLVVSSVVQTIQAIQLRKEIGTGWRVFDAVVSLAAGVLMLRYPNSGMMGVTIALAFYFFLSATAKTIFAFSLRPLPGTGWAFVSALASFALGVYILATFPVSALWMPGLLLGIQFVVHGSSLIGFSSSLRKLHREGEAVRGESPESRRAA